MKRETPWHEIRRACGHPMEPEWAALPYAVFDHIVAGHEDEQVYCAICHRWQWPDEVQERLRAAMTTGTRAATEPR